jgi:hypothetical protein
MKSPRLTNSLSDIEIANTFQRIAREFAALATLMTERGGAPVADGWVSQRDTKLGRNNHIAAVRRLQSEGATDRALTRGKLHLLRKDAYDAELQRAARKPLPPVKISAAPEPAGNDLPSRVKHLLGVR